MSAFFKVAIIDDEPESARALIEQLKTFPRFHVDGVAHDATSGISMIKRVQVFYTAHDKYMINALRNSAFDFLLKPIDRKEFEIVISRFLVDYESKPALFEREDIVNVHKDSSFMVLLPTGEMRMIKTADVGFFRYASDRKIWEAVLTTGENVSLRRNVSAEFLCAFDKKFIQVHKSYIVNMDFLVMIHDSNCVLCPPFEDCNEVVVSRKYKKGLMEQFCIF